MINENDFYIIRTRNAGVFFAKIVKLENNIAELKDSRRLWYWEGAATLSDLSQSGTKSPNNCKFPEKMSKQLVFEVIEIIKCTKKAIKSIKEVKVWEV